MFKLATYLKDNSVYLTAYQNHGDTIFRLSTLDNLNYVDFEVDNSVTNINDWMDMYLLPAISAIKTALQCSV